MGNRFGRYSKYIIQERALPDIRDGLKPVQRRILYSMNKDGNTHGQGLPQVCQVCRKYHGEFPPSRGQFHLRCHGPHVSGLEEP